MRRRVLLQRAGAIATVVTAWSLGAAPTLAASDRSKFSPVTAADSASALGAEAVSDEAAPTEEATAEAAPAAEENTEKHSARHGKKAHKTHEE